MTTTQIQDPTVEKSVQRRVLAAASIGQFVEFYDFAIYGFSVVIIAASFFPSGNPVVGVLSAFAVYGVAFVVRPLGGVFFGSLGDRIGRKAVLSISLITIGLATAAIGLLPTYDQVGLLAPILLVLLRLIQGFSAGGEAVGAPSFVLEHAPRNRRASWVSITIAMSAVPSVVAALFIFGLSESMSDPAFQSWGWRIPFFLAAPMSIIGLYIRRRTEESPAFRALEHTADGVVDAPVRAVFRTNKLRMVQVFFVMSLSALGFYFLVGYFVTYLQTVAELPRSESLLSNSIALLSFAIMLPIGGRLSDRFGRRTVMLAGALGMVLLVWPAFLLVTTGELLPAAAGQVLLAIPLCLYGGGSYTFFVELFPTATRLTGAAISYNLSFGIFGGAAPLIGTFLVQQSGTAMAPAFYLLLIAIVAGIVVLFSPETRGRELSGNVN
jgi:MHS family proline/betaine transporter-like MFS transporter